ncbi:hypothetical protein, partial [Oceanispirochaeta sp.]|uniref:hypothetical protein n=1 Tax=Oceanispirochaeta sp. TaxID=2035350 RepID=UPI00260C7247
ISGMNKSLRSFYKEVVFDYMDAGCINIDSRCLNRDSKESNDIITYSVINMLSKKKFFLLCNSKKKEF